MKKINCTTIQMNKFKFTLSVNFQAVLFHWPTNQGCYERRHAIKLYCPQSYQVCNEKLCHFWTRIMSWTTMTSSKSRNSIRIHKEDELHEFWGGQMLRKFHNRCGYSRANSYRPAFAILRLICISLIHGNKWMPKWCSSSCCYFICNVERRNNNC